MPYFKTVNSQHVQVRTTPVPTQGVEAQNHYTTIKVCDGSIREFKFPITPKYLYHELL